VQKLFCKTCGKHQQTVYINRNYTENDENEVRKHHNEGLGIRSIGRILNIPATSVQMLMERKAAKLTLPKPTKENRVMFNLSPELKQKSSSRLNVLKFNI